MTADLLEMARRFVAGSISAEQFVDAFIDRWMAERDDDAYKNDLYEIGGRLSSIFCLADLFNPSSDRKEYELDEARLREEVRKLIP
jgi:hypothetical protein